VDLTEISVHGNRAHSAPRKRRRSEDAVTIPYAE
jgi:hypothetical protein